MEVAFVFVLNSEFFDLQVFLHFSLVLLGLEQLLAESLPNLLFLSQFLLLFALAQLHSFLLGLKDTKGVFESPDFSLFSVVLDLQMVEIEDVDFLSVEGELHIGGNIFDERIHLLDFDLHLLAFLFLLLNHRLLLVPLALFQLVFPLFLHQLILHREFHCLRVAQSGDGLFEFRFEFLFLGVLFLLADEGLFVFDVEKGLFLSLALKVRLVLPQETDLGLVVNLAAVQLLKYLIYLLPLVLLFFGLDFDLLLETFEILLVNGEVLFLTGGHLLHGGLELGSPEEFLSEFFVFLHQKLLLFFDSIVHFLNLLNQTQHSFLLLFLLADLEEELVLNRL